MIREIHDRPRGTNGSQRIMAELRYLEVRIGKFRLSRLMKELDIAGASRR
ncbi:MAG: IS3 family transposase [Xanthomonadaceae bacterium]|nr:IS3 family transposase [Xanthomonadaceae bacterium]